MAFPGTETDGQAQPKNYLSDWLQYVVPQWVARRAITVSVRTVGTEFSPGEPVPIVATFHNRLPFPILLQTPQRRLWGWKVDDYLEASDERRYTRDEGNELLFGAGEAIRLTFEWNGTIKKSDTLNRWVTARPGTHTIEVFIPAVGGSISDRTEILITG